MGDTFPETFTCLDLRVRTSENATTFIQDVGRLCRYPSAPVPDDTNANDIPGSQMLLLPESSLLQDIASQISRQAASDKSSKPLSEPYPEAAAEYQMKLLESVSSFCRGTKLQAASTSTIGTTSGTNFAWPSSQRCTPELRQPLHPLIEFKTAGHSHAARWGGKSPHEITTWLPH